MSSQYFRFKEVVKRRENLGSNYLLLLSWWAPKFVIEFNKDFMNCPKKNRQIILYSFPGETATFWIQSARNTVLKYLGLETSKGTIFYKSTNTWRFLEDLRTSFCFSVRCPTYLSYSSYPVRHDSLSIIVGNCRLL